MFKRHLLMFLIIFLSFSVSSTISAKTTYPAVKAALVVKASPAPTPSPTPAPVDSFALFWPISSGKTMTSKLYSLKLLKEKVRGWFIFGSSQKADYELLLGTKRLLETEALASLSNADLANKTLDLAITHFSNSERDLVTARNDSGVPSDIRAQMGDRTARDMKFVNWLISKNKDEKDKLQNISDTLVKIASNL